MGDTLLIRAGLLNPVDANRWTFHREGGLLLEGERWRAHEKKLFNCRRAGPVERS